MTREIGAGRILARGWPVMLAAVLGNAAAQALLILGEPATALDPGFVLRVLGSIIALMVSGWLIVSAAGAAAQGRPFAFGGAASMLWTVGVVVAAAASWILSPFAVPFVLVVGLLLLPASGAPYVLRSVLGVVRRHPWRVLLAALLTIVLSAVVWVLGLITGFFVTGPLGTFLAWLVAGVAVALAVAVWTSIHHRGAHQLPSQDASTAGQ